MMDPNPNRKQLPMNSESSVPARPVDVIYRDTYRSEQVDDQAVDSLREQWLTIRRHKGTVLLIAIIGGLVGFLVTVPQTPVYRAHTSLEVQGLNSNFLNIRDVNPTANTDGADAFSDILTQIQLLQSESLRDTVVKKIVAEKAGVPLNAPAGRLAAWGKALGIASPQSTTWESTISAVANTVAIKDTANTRIIEVTCDSPDPQLAARYANALVGEFIDQAVESRMGATQKTTEWLTRQMEDVRINLERSEDQLQSYASSAGLQFISDNQTQGGSENVDEDKLRKLEEASVAAEADRVAAQSKYELISTAPPDSLPQILDDATMRDYQTRLADLRRQRADLGVALTSTNPKIVRLDAQIAELEKAQSRERANVIERIKNDFQAAERRERLIASEHTAQAKIVSDQAAKTIHYNILKREVDTNRTVYESMLQKMKEAGLASALNASSYRVVDPAKPPIQPFKPVPMQSAGLGTFGGVLLGFTFVLVRERMDRRLQQPGDLMQYVNLPELGVIPSATFGSSKIAYYTHAAPKASVIRTTKEQGVGLPVWTHKSSRLAESFQATLTSILFSKEFGFRPQVLVLCSAGPSEGKSTVTSNLAVALAEINRRVLLIDADMRRPRQHSIFELQNQEGLSSLLRQRRPILSNPSGPYIQETQVPGLHLMTSGPIEANASNLLHSPRLGELLVVLRSEYDAILIDTPPMLHLADGRVIGQHSDAVILVVRAGKTTRDAAMAARKKFQEDGAPILGTILNDWHPGGNSEHYAAKSYKAYSKYVDK